MFECYGVPGISYVTGANCSYFDYCIRSKFGNKLPKTIPAPSAVLGTAIVIEIGNCTTHVVPIIDGKVQHHKIKRFEIILNK